MKYSRKMQRLHELQITRGLKLHKELPPEPKHPQHRPSVDSSGSTDSNLK